MSPTDLHPLALSFRDPALEGAWWRRFADDHRRHLQLGVALLALLFAAFASIDVWAFPRHLGPLLAIRFGVAVPALLALGWVPWSSRARAWLDEHVQEYLAGVGVVALGSLLAIGYVLSDGAGREQTQVAGLGVAMGLGFLYGFSRLRFAYAAPLGVITTVGALAMIPRTETTPLLAAQFVVFAAATNAAGLWVTYALERLARRAFAREVELGLARARSDALLRNVLPAAIAERLKDAVHMPTGGRAAVAERHDAITVVVADLVGFTALAERLPPEELAALLDRVFGRFDALCTAHGVEKIKTLGDGWVAAAGVPVSREDHAEAAARLALDMLGAVKETGRPVSLRIGVHTGSAVAGVIGRTRFAYDLWGEAVDGAVQAEHGGEDGSVRISASTAERLGPGFVVDEREGPDGTSYWLLGTTRAPTVA